jgi:hypothetical protein
MSDPTAEQLAAAKSQLQADGTPGVTLPASEEELGARAAAAGMGATETDTQALLAQLLEQQARMVAQIAALEAERKATGGEHPLVGTAQSLAAVLAGYPVPEIEAAAAELVDAAKNALDSGDTTYVSKINARLGRLLRRNAPPPGENYHYKQAVEHVEFHVPDVVEGFVPPARPVTAVGGGAPVKVIAGSVTG